MADRRPRANFTLDEEHTIIARKLIDDHEQQHGFRPTMAQLINGLLRKAKP